MSERSEAIASQFGEANREFVALVESIPEDQWGTQAADEERPIGVVAHHVADGYSTTFGFAQMLGSGGDAPEFSMDQVHASNAEHAAKYASVSKAETLALLQTNGEQVEAGLREMTDEQLDLAINVPVMGGEMTVEQLINGLVIGHIGMHKPGIKGALE